MAVITESFYRMSTWNTCTVQYCFSNYVLSVCPSNVSKRMYISPHFLLSGSDIILVFFFGGGTIIKKLQEEPLSRALITRGGKFCKYRPSSQINRYPMIWSDLERRDANCQTFMADRCNCAPIVWHRTTRFAAITLLRTGRISRGLDTPHLKGRGPALHWSCITNNSGISTYRLTALVREMLQSK